MSYNQSLRRIASCGLSVGRGVYNQRVLASQVYECRRHAHSARFNTGVVFVPQQEAWVVERLGKFNRILG